MPLPSPPPHRSILFNDPLLPPNPSNFIVKFIFVPRGGRGARANEEGGGDEATNRNYPSLNMRFTESTIQIREGRGGERSLCNPLYLIRTANFNELGILSRLVRVITCLPPVPFVTGGSVQKRRNSQICLTNVLSLREVDRRKRKGKRRSTHLEKTRVIFPRIRRKHGRSVSREGRIGDARKSLPTCIFISLPLFLYIRNAGRSFLSGETGLITELGR